MIQIRFLRTCIKFILIFIFLHNQIITAGLKSAAGKVLHISSLKQNVVDENKIIFEGEVEALIDQKLHLCADKVNFDRNRKYIVAQMHDRGPVKLETNDFIILADYIFLDLEKKTGKAENIRIHVDEGYFAAQSAERVDEFTWKLEDLIYTACDDSSPHWKFEADQAVVHGNYFVRLKNPVFKIGKVPVLYVPTMICPIQGKSKSGFLLPKFSWDYFWGPGVNLQYYKYLGQHIDTTLGMDWKDRLGVVLSDEFRWARSTDSYTKVLGQFAIANNVYVPRNNKIVEATDRRYGVHGKDFGNLGKLAGKTLRSLIRADFGTDKRICYHFFNNTDEVDDTFSNSVILRACSKQTILEVRGDNDNTSRKSFYDVNENEFNFVKKIIEDSSLKRQKHDIKNQDGEGLVVKKEVGDKLNVTKVPHVECGMANKIFKEILFYRHDFFFDQAWYRQSETERLYVDVNSQLQLINQTRLMPLEKGEVFRLGYRGLLQTSFNLSENNFRLFVEPQFQYRSDVLHDIIHKKNVIEGHFLGNGAYRIFSKFGAEWALPEGAEYNEDFSCSYFVQPVLKWNFLPKFYQDNWYYIDFWDRAYPTNELAFCLRNNGNWHDFQIDFNVEQGFDFYDKKDIFCMRRGVSSRHLTPFNYNLSFGYDIFKIWVDQEVEFDKCKLLQSQFGLGIFKDKLGISASYLFQNRRLQVSREQLTNIPHFVLLNFSIPLSKHASLFYNGQFYDEDNKNFANLAKIKPLIHQIKLDFNGHCWGFYVGFEQKKYREYGNKRTENAIIFALRLDSLGSIAKKFRPPQILHKD